jgi:hypothetical protein
MSIPDMLMANIIGSEERQNTIHLAHPVHLCSELQISTAANQSQLLTGQTEVDRVKAEA